MPSAGGICPPMITPLRKNVETKYSTKIDSTTLIKLSSDTSGCKIYFTTDGTKPSPFKRKVAGQEITFKYFAPFTLKQGKRTIKAIAVSRDGLQESAIVTRTLIVDDDDQLTAQKHTANNYYDEPEVHLSYSQPQCHSPFRQSVSEPSNLKQAWSSPACHNIPDTPKEVPVNPDIPFYPTNYAGTQINMFGMPTNKIPFGLQDFQTGMKSPTQFGFITEQMIQGLSPQSKPVTIGDIRKLLEESQRFDNHTKAPSLALPEPPPPRTEATKQSIPKELPLQNISPGNGDVKAQIMHISSHLLQYAKTDKNFAMAVAGPQIGKLLTADFTDEGDGYKMTLLMAKPGVTMNNQRVSEFKVKSTKQKKSDPPKKLDPPKKVDPPKNVDPSKKKIPKSDSYFEMETEDIIQEGTVNSYADFNAEYDCKVLQNAMKGLGTDEDAIINVLAYRSNPQRQEIIQTFKTMFGKDLVKELKGELSGNFKDCVKSLCMKPAEFDADLLRNAMKNFGTDEDLLIEILCTRSNAQIKQIVSTYNKIFNRDLEKDVISETSGYLKRLLVSMVSANRSESTEIDRNQAIRDAKALHEAGEKQWGTDESKFHTILVTRSFPQLRAIFEEYAKLSKKDIEKVLKSELSGDFLRGTLTIVRCVKNKANYFAQQLQKAMKGTGTDDSALVRIIVSRCEIDMVQIKEEFFKITKQPLEDWISDDISGDYRKIILSLINGTAAQNMKSKIIYKNKTGKKEIKIKTPVIKLDIRKTLESNPVGDNTNHETAEQIDKEENREETLTAKSKMMFPTVVPYSDFNSEQDCETLYNAFKGFGTDEKAIINVMAYRSSHQRIEIRQDFMQIYGKDLTKELKSELSGHFKDVVVGLCMSSPEFDATQLNKAVKSLGTNEQILTEIICSRSNEQLKDIKIIYQRLFKNNLEVDIANDTSGDYKKILTSLLQGRRKSDESINVANAKQEAQRLYEAGESKRGTDEAVFIEILCTNSFSQLLVIFEEYKKAHKKDIADVIKSEMSGNAKESLLTIVACCRDTAVYFASVLYKAMKGLGTDDDTLIRVIISRSEVDLQKIKEQFKTMYKKTLSDFISDDISGDYKEIILALLN